ncbi:hypothetical protein L6452_25287 [Arctium lappa]|uniref:Uncharacterized protein n=1 Tax=Arctium lappa TaxID=4217 RepID=A0ACB9ABT1_ARCLA|nr:hypothetical protein L6452_25287 [Arctium lappa]
MSMSESDMSFQGGNDHKNFRKISRDRLLYEMIRSAKRQDSKSSWKLVNYGEAKPGGHVIATSRTVFRQLGYNRANISYEPHAWLDHPVKQLSR